MRPPSLASCHYLHSLKQCLLVIPCWLLKVSFGSCVCLDALPYSWPTVCPLGLLPALSLSPWGDCVWEKEESLGLVVFWGAVKIASSIQHISHAFQSWRNNSREGNVRGERKCSQGKLWSLRSTLWGWLWQDCADARVMQNGGWGDSQMTRKEAFWRHIQSWHRREMWVTIWRKAPFGIAPHQRWTFQRCG